LIIILLLLLLSGQYNGCTILVINSTKTYRNTVTEFLYLPPFSCIGQLLKSAAEDVKVVCLQYHYI